VDEHVELPVEHLPHLGHDALDIAVVTNVAGGDQRARDRIGQLADALLDPLALERERELRAFLGQAPPDRPRDRAFVRDTCHEPPLALEPRHEADPKASLPYESCAASSCFSSRSRRSPSQRRRPRLSNRSIAPSAN
jgi:hypothetical protein